MCYEARTVGWHQYNKTSAILIDLSGGGAQWGHGITIWSGNIQMITIFVDLRISISIPKAEFGTIQYSSL